MKSGTEQCLTTHAFRFAHTTGMRRTNPYHARTYSGDSIRDRLNTPGWITIAAQIGKRVSMRQGSMRCMTGFSMKEQTWKQKN